MDARGSCRPHQTSRRRRPIRRERRPLNPLTMTDTTRKIRWGILGVASIATRKVIPSMQQGQWSTVTGIASRDLRKAQQAAAALGIPKAYGSYDAMLDDPDIDAIYNPLPNHLHVPYSAKAAERGKHV